MTRLTIRARLTLLYVVLFTLAGLALLAITYFLVQRQMSTNPFDAKLVLTDLMQVKGDLKELRQLLQTKAQEANEATLTTIITQGGIALALILAAATGVAWVIAGRALHPLHQITATAGRIAAGVAGRGLHERIALAGPKDEVKQLADTFDAMLSRLDHSFDGQRRFVANASHELRTPLALNRALVELAITRPDASADARQLGESLLKVNERHERLIDGLLMLADSESPVTEQTPVDLADIAEYVVEALPAGGPTVTSMLDPAPVTGDPVLLERLVQNLVENAVRHNVPDGWLRVETATVGGRARLVVTNSGPAVPAYEMEAIFQPFRRLGRERIGGPSRGLGLGLSIVRAIAQAHHGTAVAAPRPGGGLTVTTTL